MRLLLPLLLLAACPTPATVTPPASGPATEISPGSAPASAPAGDLWLGVFPAYPGARYLCWQSIVGIPMHINWSAYATPDAPEKVRAFYEAGPAAAMIDRSNGFSLVGPEKKIVSVHARADHYPTCEVLPGDGDQTVFIVSQASP